MSNLQYSNNTKAIADKDTTSVLGLDFEDWSSMVDLNWPIDNYSVIYVDEYNEGGLVGSDPYIDMELGIG